MLQRRIIFHCHSLIKCLIDWRGELTIAFWMGIPVTTKFILKSMIGRRKHSLVGTFAFRRMPFGVCNSPATFQRCMLVTFHNMVEDYLKVFMDDFSVVGDSFEDCLENLEKCEEKDLVLN